MIVNLPTEESLNNVALRTYFRAWDLLVAIWVDFGIQFPEGNSFVKPSRIWVDEWSDYLVQSQSDMQSVCSLLQQSMELALKARICAVSPYLLLLDSGLKLSTASKSIEFSGLRTLDAVDLPGAVNTLTDRPVSDDFIQIYARLRALRNKITHLGEASVSLKPVEILRQCIALYLSVWTSRNWLSDRLLFAAQTRSAWLHDGKYTSVHMEVLQEWPLDVELFTNAEFEKLFGKKKSVRRYLCHDCVDAGDTRYAGLQKPGCGTAHLNAEGTKIMCLMCDRDFHVARNRCPECNGNVIGSEDTDWIGRCHTCGIDTLQEESEGVQ